MTTKYWRFVADLDQVSEVSLLVLDVMSADTGFTDLLTEFLGFSTLVSVWKVFTHVDQHIKEKRNHSHS